MKRCIATLIFWLTFLILLPGMLIMTWAAKNMD